MTCNERLENVLKGSSCKYENVCKTTVNVWKTLEIPMIPTII